MLQNIELKLSNFKQIRKGQKLFKSVDHDHILFLILFLSSVFYFLTLFFCFVLFCFVCLVFFFFLRRLKISAQNFETNYGNYVDSKPV